MTEAKIRPPARHRSFIHPILQQQEQRTRGTAAAARRRGQSRCEKSARSTCARPALSPARAKQTEIAKIANGRWPAGAPVSCGAEHLIDRVPASQHRNERTNDRPVTYTLRFFGNFRPI